MEDKKLDKENINHLYFKHTNKRKFQDNRRSALAKREIETLSILKEITSGNFLHENSNVVDLGCGDKHLKNAFNEINVNYHGYDIDRINLEHDSIPHDDNSVDLIISFAVIEHLKNPNKMLNESLRCLKVGGSIMISTPNFEYSYKNFYDDYTHIKPYTPKSLSCLIKDIGFCEVKDFPNLRCKSKFSYTNKYRYALANARPFSANPPFSFFIPSFMKGRSKGMFVIAKKL